MTPIDLILWVGALVCFGMSAGGVPVPRINLVGLGLFLAALTVIVP